MEIPEKLWPYLGIWNPLGLPTWLSRFDFVYDDRHKLHMVEINSDTPCAVIEAFYGNGVYLTRGEDSPTSSGEAAKWREESPTSHKSKSIRSSVVSKRKGVDFSFQRPKKSRFSLPPLREKNPFPFCWFLFLFESLSAVY